MIRLGICFVAIAMFASAAAIPLVWIQVNYGGYWGNWGRLEFCPAGYPAVGFSLKVEGIQGNGDDTALNSISLKCADGSWIKSDEGRWGVWTPVKQCQNGYLSQFRLRVESPQGDGDDTAANDIDFVCTSEEVLNGDSPTSWGEWGPWSGQCTKGIRGINTRVEGVLGDGGDDTALNDVQFSCEL